MLSVVGCIFEKHNIWLVLLAALVCIAGAWTALRLFNRARQTKGLQAAGWHFLTAVAAGGSIWCTHFIAMLAYEVPGGFELDPVMTMVSLLIAICGTSLGFVIAGLPRRRFAAPLGGAVIGLAIAAMHYTGMLAYRVEGLVSWKQGFLIASFIMAVGFSAAAMTAAVREDKTWWRYAAAVLLVLGIVTLHFTGMTAFSVIMMNVPLTATNAHAAGDLAMSVAVVGLLIVGTGVSSYLIDGENRNDNIRQLRRMALSDVLTGLPNRAAFSDRLEREMNHVRISGGQVGLVIFDLDRFKEINDVRGHAAGDEVLQAVARRVSAVLHGQEFVARLGGDEFAALIRYNDSADLRAFVERLRLALIPVILIEDYEVAPGASFGVASFPSDAADRETLLGNADLAMYRAKNDLTASVCIYEPAMDESVRERRALTADLRDAISAGQLEVHYQVQTSISSGEPIGYEALLRWKHPTRGFIPPVDFIPLAEESGLILDIGEWVLRTACEAAATWSKPLKIAVNLSPVQFAHANLPRMVHQTLIATGLNPHRLELELTESTIIGDKVRSLHILRQIKALGVSVALDDFGTGYSSLETLRAFPFDKIKLDRSFMSEIETSLQAKAIVRAVLALGKSLEVPVLAEGIETPAQLNILAAEGCDEGQGYFLGRPGPLNVSMHEALIDARALRRAS